MPRTPCADGNSKPAEGVYLDQEHGRQILHVTFGSVLTEKTDHDYLLRERIRTILRQNRQLHEDVLRDHLGKHMQMLLMGYLVE